MAFLQEYTMLDELGRGGFATVYKVRHNELGYIRAVRVLNETIAVKEGEDPKQNMTYQKFLRECTLLLRLGNGNHPNIVHIYQPRYLESRALVEMDYVDGQDIMHYLKQNQNFVPVEEVLHMAMQMSSALAYCHEDIYKFCMDRDMDNLKDDPNDGSKVLIDDQTRKRLIEKYKVIHNDIHSGNIIRREDGNFVLLDFGLAINGCEVVRSSRRKNGAPEFKSPEKWDDESVLTEQSDIYSFGIVLYQYLAGRVPFPYNTHTSGYKAEFELGEAHQKATPPSIEPLRKEFYEKKFKGQEYKKDYPQWLEDVIMKCLSKNPKDRFKNGKELHACISKHALEEAKVSEGMEKKIEQLKAQNEEQALDMEHLRRSNRLLNMALDEKQNALLRAEQLLNEAHKGNDTLVREKQSQQIEIDRLQQEIKEQTEAFRVEKESQQRQIVELQLKAKEQGMDKAGQQMLLKLEQSLREAKQEIGILRGEKNELQRQVEQLTQKTNSEVKSTATNKKEDSTVAPPPAKRYCKRCGELLSPTAKYCKKCGLINRPV
ncbi:MAG: protein kinase [Bacteroidales bacterium]|nr:protein kinase [Bacteroidales bacterium]